MEERNRFIYCEDCKEHHYEKSKCNPIYYVFFEEYMGDDSKAISATSYQQAAEKFAHHYNTNSDYCLMNNEIEISVEFQGVTKKFKVGAEPDIQYTSEEIC